MMIKKIKHIVFAPWMIWRKLIEIDRKVDAVDYLLRASIDIAKVNNATGNLRLLQKANAVFLKKVVAVLESNGISYWINFGTLLGAVRHNGFIPWDDDLDICVLRSDKDRILNCLASLCSSGKVKIIASDCVRVRFLNTPCQVDLFFVDNVLLTPGDKKQIDVMRKEYLALQDQLQCDFGKLKTDEPTILNKNQIQIDKMARAFSEAWEGDTQYVSVGFESMIKFRLWRKDWIFPLQRMKFEGLEVWAPCDPDSILKNIYGDYMAFPRWFDSHSDIVGKMTPESCEKMEELIERGCAF